ncbi:MAG: pitrilysin family protein [Rhodospirillaceae bacterium]
MPAWAAKVERVVSPGGIEAWLVQDHLNPIITVNFSFRGGSALDPAGKEGLASMAASLLDEGAGELDSKALRQVLEDLSITLRFDEGRDNFGGRLKTLTEYRDKAFGLLADALTKPRFDAEPVERLRAQILAKLRHDAENPDAIAGKALMAELFPGHPYGKPSDGTKESVARIMQADLKKFVADRLARDTVAIGVVGDIKPEELAPLLDKTFGRLPMKAAPWKVPSIAPKAHGQTVVVDKTIDQSNILFAEKGLARKDKDFYTAYVMNHILGGGGFTSRLYTEVREKRGLAYSVYSYLNPMDWSAIYIGGAGTANARVKETLDVVRDEWRKMAETGVTQQELDDAKSYLTGSFPLRFTSLDRIASMLVGMQLDDLGMDFLERRNEYIEQVTIEGIRRVARNLLDSKNLVFVVVGKPEGLKAK